MTGQLSMFNQSITPKDVVFTPDLVARDILKYFHPAGIILDPCRGDGAFYNQFPFGSTTRYCEIAEGKDFFNFNEKVDWIIGNPPYSIFLDWMRHSFRISNDVVYLVPTNNIFQSWKLMRVIENFGGIRTMLVYGSGHKVGLPFGFSVGAFHFQKNWRGEVTLKFRIPPPLGLKRT